MARSASGMSTRTSRSGCACGPQGTGAPSRPRFAPSSSRRSPRPNPRRVCSGRSSNASATTVAWSWPCRRERPCLAHRPSPSDRRRHQCDVRADEAGAGRGRTTWVLAARRVDLFTTAITVAEIRYGIERLPDGRRQNERRDTAEEILRDVRRPCVAVRRGGRPPVRGDRAPQGADGPSYQRLRCADRIDLRRPRRHPGDPATLWTSRTTGIDLVDPWRGPNGGGLRRRRRAGAVPARRRHPGARRRRSRRCGCWRPARSSSRPCCGRLEGEERGEGPVGLVGVGALDHLDGAVLELDLEAGHGVDPTTAGPVGKTEAPRPGDLWG